MTIQIRLFSLVISLLLVLGTDAMAASKRRHRGGKRRPAASKHVPKHADPAPSAHGNGAEKNGGAAQVDTRSEEKAPARAESLKQESRIEFDERMLKGQTASGVIYLFQRTPSDWKSIVEVPESFRPRTVEILEGETK